MDQYSMQLSSQQSGTGSSIHSNDQKTFSTSEASISALNNFSITSTNYQPTDFISNRQDKSNVTLLNAILVTGEPAKSPQFLPASNSEINSDTETKLIEARKKGRPPKSENHSTEGFCCNICNKTFSNSSSLAKHRVTHSQERKFVCTECNKTFKRHDHLAGHMLTHSEVKPFVCSKCDKSYCDTRSLRRHQEQYHSVAPAKNPPAPEQACPAFDGRAKEVPESNLLASVLAKEDVFEDFPKNPAALCDSIAAAYSCKMCSRSFKTTQALNGHMRLHTGTSSSRRDEEASQKHPVIGVARNPTLLQNAALEKMMISISGKSRNAFDLHDVPPCADASSIQGTTRVEERVVKRDVDEGDETTASSPFDGALYSGPASSVQLTTPSKVVVDAGVLFVDGAPQLLNYMVQPQLHGSSRPHQQLHPLLMQHVMQSNMILQLQNYDAATADAFEPPFEAGPTAFDVNAPSNRKLESDDGDIKPPHPYTVLHSLLQKTDHEQKHLQPPQRFTPVVFPCEVSGGVSTSASHGTISQELLGNYGEDENFDGMNLDAEGIEKLLSGCSLGGQEKSSSKDNLLKDESIGREDSGMESLIPEDLRSIPTHALHMFSLSTVSSDVQPPRLERDGSIGTEDAPGYGRREFPGRVDAERIAGDACGVSDVQGLFESNWSEEQILRRDIINNILNMSRYQPHEDEVSSKSGFTRQDEANACVFAANGTGEEAENDERESDDPPGAVSSQGAEKIEKFRNPSLLKMKRRHWPGPLIIPASVPSPAAGQLPLGASSSSLGSSAFAFQSRLRSPRIMPGSGSFDSDVPPPFSLPFVPYTPPPMLSPMRNGSGLFCLIQAALATQTPPITKSRRIGRPNSPELFESFVEEVVSEESVPEEPPTTDIKPHINEGPNYQAEIPDLEANPKSAFDVDDHAEMVWNPSLLQNISENEMRAFMDFSSSAAIPYNGCNKELAHHFLYLYAGDIKNACLSMMESCPALPPNQFVDDYKYSETSDWSLDEIEKFTQSILKNSKDFFVVSKEVESKTCKECIEFYYLWKKVCIQESSRLKTMRRKHDSMYSNLRSKTLQPFLENSADTAEIQDRYFPLHYIPNFSEELQPPPTKNIQSYPFPLLSSPESSQAPPAPQKTSMPAPKRPGRHPRAGGRSNKPRPKPPILSPTLLNPDVNTIFPCKVCKKVFYKVKSRSAHMKTHRMQPNPKKSQPSPPRPHSYRVVPSVHSFEGIASAPDLYKASPKGGSGVNY